jgi:hypothetical protein
MLRLAVSVKRGAMLNRKSRKGRMIDEGKERRGLDEVVQLFKLR